MYTKAVPPSGSTKTCLSSPAAFNAANEGMTALLGGHVDVSVGTLGVVLPQVQAGKVTGIAVTSRERLSLLPDVPSVAESGIKGYEMSYWFAAYLPAKTPPAVARRVYELHQEFYDRLQQDVQREARARAAVDPDEAIAQAHAGGLSPRVDTIASRCAAAVILISGCQDNQTSMDGDHNGAFTEQLLRVWNRGAYKGTYAKFHAAIKASMDPRQTPNLFTMGPASAFVKEQPFAL